MTPINIPAGASTTCINYLGVEYVAYPSTTAGAAFYVLGVDVTTSITAINTSGFVDTVTAVVDPVTTIIDDAFNVYYKVNYYTIVTSARPPRI